MLQHPSLYHCQVFSVSSPLVSAVSFRHNHWGLDSMGGLSHNRTQISPWSLSSEEFIHTTGFNKYYLHTLVYDWNLNIFIWLNESGCDGHMKISSGTIILGRHLHSFIPFEIASGVIRCSLRIYSLVTDTWVTPTCQKVNTITQKLTFWDLINSWWSIQRLFCHKLHSFNSYLTVCSPCVSVDSLWELWFLSQSED